MLNSPPVLHTSANTSPSFTPLPTPVLPSRLCQHQSFLHASANTRPSFTPLPTHVLPSRLCQHTSFLHASANTSPSFTPLPTPLTPVLPSPLPTSPPVHLCQHSRQDIVTTHKPSE
ncbi:hypothetical protein Pcinc_016374 [Petrolisthes cinctipes]|uniref:Uncharacterized protein n=1 Tax=Petrolisthes cinctipes TaxID=88211 RepID=A0AAE1FSY7_PETCI|nr:hypothetical protein Pcinc_016374 [Petrolisthes cinctipes]